MFLTANIVREKGACEAGIKWMERYFPEGGELKDVISHEKCPDLFLHWGYNYLPADEEERKVYRERMHIESQKPKTISDSSEVNNSEYVFMGRKIKDSAQISSSKEVTDSFIVQASRKIDKSKRIFNSKEVQESMDVYDSNNIKNSQNIVNSSEIINCADILNGQEISDSFYIIGTEEKAKKIRNSYFIFNGNELHHCLFCDTVNSSQFLLFNQPISEQEYDIYVKQLMELKEEWHPSFLSAWTSEQLPLIPPTQLQEDQYCMDIPIQLLSWIKNLPNFNQQILDNILKR